MNVLARIFRFLFWVLIVSWAVRLLRRWITNMLRNAATRAQQSTATTPDAASVTKSHRLVRDPVCGVHITEERAIRLQDNQEIVHFCSAACRDQYVSDTRRFAANA
jgi:YHS domain-containing protein